MVLTFLPLNKAEPTVMLERLYLRPPVRADWAAWAELRSESREFLTPWEPKWPEDALTRAAFRRRLARYAEEWSRDQGYSFFLFRREDHQLVGGVSIANVRRGVAQSGSLGYWVGRRHARQGYMSEAVAGACRFAFGQLVLHRLDAACLPHNEASQGVLRRLGFRYEGLAKQYLKINDQWQDHVLFALLHSEIGPPTGPSSD